MRQPLFALALLAATAGHAQTPPASVDLAAVLQLARQDNPRLAIAFQRF